MHGSLITPDDEELILADEDISDDDAGSGVAAADEDDDIDGVQKMSECRRDTEVATRCVALQFYSSTSNSDCRSHSVFLSGVTSILVNPLTGTLKRQSNEPLYINTAIGTLAVDGWAVTFGTARRGLGGLRPRPMPSALYQQ